MASWRAQLRSDCVLNRVPLSMPARILYAYCRSPRANTTRAMFGLGSLAALDRDLRRHFKRDELHRKCFSLECFHRNARQLFKEQHIGDLWRHVQPISQPRLPNGMHESVSQLSSYNGYHAPFWILESTAHFMMSLSLWWGELRIPELRLGITTRVLWAFGRLPTDTIRTHFLHFLLALFRSVTPHNSK